MKILRLSPQDARTWRENRSVLVDERGDHVRHIELSETRVLSELQKRARATRQPQETDFKYMTPAGEVTSRLAVSFRELGRATMMVSMIDHHEVVEGREFFKRQVLKVHGECQLRSHTGQFMCAVRDANIARPTAKDAQRAVPRAEHCQCKSWGNPHPGRHHASCENNLKAPLEEQSLPDDTSMTMTSQRVLPGARPAEKPSVLHQASTHRPNAAEATAQVEATIVAATKPIPDPTTCVCKDFVMPHTGDKRPDGIHHPLCQHKEAWDAMNLPKMFLVSLSTGKVARRATAEEIEEAAGEIGYITIGSEQFGVLPEEEVMGVAKKAAEAAVESATVAAE